MKKKLLVAICICIFNSIFGQTEIPKHELVAFEGRSLYLNGYVVKDGDELQKLISMKKYALYPAVFFPEKELEGLFEVVNNDFENYKKRLEEISRLNLMVAEENRLLAYGDTINTIENRRMQDIMSMQGTDIKIKADQIRLMAENIEILSKTNESLQESNSHYQRQLQSDKKWPYLFGASFGISIGLVLGLLIN